MQPKIPLAEYRFVYQAIDPVSLPAFADPLWRSVFGLALRQLSCIAETPDHADCNTCMLKHQCDYSFLTTGPNPPGEKKGVTRNMQNIPNPHVFQSEIRDYTTNISAGATFTARINLIGNANDRLPAVIRAMVKTGMLGLGRKRSKMQLLEVHQTGPGPLDRLIMKNQEIIAAGIPESIIIPKAPKTALFSFQSPYLLPSNTKVDKGFNATKFIMQIIRRISSLQEPYTGIPIDTDFKHLKALAIEPAIPDTNLNAEERYSYFSDNKRFLAVRGEIVLSLKNHKKLWPWIYIGQWLNIGKQASKGFGRYMLTAIED